MGLFGSVSGKDVDAFARSLVAGIAKDYPPAANAGGTTIVAQKKVAASLESALKKAVDFKKEHKLGIYKTARLGNTVRWELKEMGYSEQFIEALVQDLVVRMSVK